MEQEGVIKYRLAFKHRNIQIDDASLEELNSARTKLLDKGLIGQDDTRYDGYGFGNISKRCLNESHAFWISGTQTGHLQNLSHMDVCLVMQAYHEVNTIVAQGRVSPSSESMTHGVLYQLDPRIQAVIHVHSPDIWHNRSKLKLPATPSDIPYGTPEMAKSVIQLTKKVIKNEWPILFCMDGHEDGVVAAGSSLEQCINALLNIQLTAQSFS